jgi:DNA-binding response OmpR family regulator
LEKAIASIMVVDDEADIANLFQVFLEDSGYLVEVYYDPLKALTEFKPGKYDLSLLDVRMPHMNGFELYRELKRLDYNCRICFITAFESYYKSLKEFFPTLEVSCYIRKPVTKEQLLNTVAREIDTGD